MSLVQSLDLSLSVDYIVSIIPGQLGISALSVPMASTFLCFPMNCAMREKYEPKGRIR